MVTELVPGHTHGYRASKYVPRPGNFLQIIDPFTKIITLKKAWLAFRKIWLNEE